MKKNTCIKAFSAILALTLSLGLGTALSTKKAAADETVVNGVATQGFYVKSGASVYVGDNNSAGIKYETYVTKAFQSYLEDTYQNATFEWHTLITGTNMITNNDVTQVTPALKKPESVGENAGKPACQDLTSTLKELDEQVTDLDEDGTVDDKYAVNIVYHNLTDEEKAQHGKADLIARSYVLVTKADETTEIIYSKAEDTVRNMRAVAYSAIRSGEYKANETALWKYTGVTTANVIAYDSEMDNTGVIDVAELSTTGSYDVYCGAKELTVSAVDRANGQITVGNFPTNLEEGKVYDLVLYSNTDNSILTQPFIYATKVLRTLADFNMFVQSSTDADGDYNTVLDGYYVLGNDIDVSKETVSANKSFTQVYKLASHTEFNLKKEQGLTGTFDGNGHTINGLVMRGAGLFWRVCEGATVKNFALTELNLADSSNTAALACQVRGTLENIFVQTSKAAKTYNALLASQIILSTTAKMNNIVVDGEDFVSTTSNSFGIVQNNQSACNNDTSKNVSNVYFISTSICGGNNTNGAKVDAGNRSVKTKTDGSAISLNVIYGAKRYDSWADMKEGATYDPTTDAKVENVTETNDYSSFTKYWTITDGVPVWTGNPNK